MPSQAKIDANRRNAALSTGPKSANGKYIVSKNAVRHGLLSAGGVLLDEDQAEFAAFQEKWERELAPEGEIEKSLVEGIIWLAWRIRRVPRIEAGLHLWHRHSQSREGIVGWSETEYRARVAKATADANTAEIRLIDVKDRGASAPSAQELADHSAERGFSAHAWDIQACMNLERYEARIERRLRKLLAQLEARQARRRNPEKRSNKAKPETSE